MSIFPTTLPLFSGYPLMLVSSTNLHVFATTVCLLTLRPTYLTFLPFTPLPVSFAHVLTTLSSVVHLSVQYPMIKCISQTLPRLLRTLFISRSALLITSLLSDPELKLTFSVLPTNCLNASVVICVPQSASGGRVVKGVGHLDHGCLKLRCAGGREFDHRPGQYSRMSFSSDPGD